MAVKRFFIGQEEGQETIASDSTAAVLDSSGLQNLLLDGDRWLVVLTSGLRIIFILFMAWLIIRVVDKAANQWHNRYAHLPDAHPGRQRAFTVSTLLSSSTRYIVWPVAIIMVLSELRLDVTALLATAGIAGIAIGFGAQTLVQDFISGVLMLFDDTIHVGDWIRIGNDKGIVEYIGVRLIKVRQFNGELLMVPAGELRVFGNRSIDYVRVIVNVGLAYEQDLESTLPVMQRIADEWAEENKDILIDEGPQVQALLELGDSSINARVIVRVKPGEQWEAERALRRRMKQEFDKEGVEIPFPRRTVYIRQEDST